jgi:hypothetical protein
MADLLSRYILTILQLLYGSSFNSGGKVTPQDYQLSYAKSATFLCNLTIWLIQHFKHSNTLIQYFFIRVYLVGSTMVNYV